jgi:hypothetical protein
VFDEDAVGCFDCCRAGRRWREWVQRFGQFERASGDVVFLFGYLTHLPEYEARRERDRRQVWRGFQDRSH